MPNTALSGVAGTNSFPARSSIGVFVPKSALALLFVLFITSNFEQRGWIYNNGKWFKTCRVT